MSPLSKAPLFNEDGADEVKSVALLRKLLSVVKQMPLLTKLDLCSLDGST